MDDITEDMMMYAAICIWNDEISSKGNSVAPNVMHKLCVVWKIDRSGFFCRGIGKFEDWGTSIKIHEPLLSDICK